MTNEEVIKELNEELKEVNLWLEVYKRNGEVCEKREIRKVVLEAAIKALDIELLTDTEQRIFLKAMSREREICQKVDDEFLDDDSRVSLVKICDSIERKVKKIWE